MLIRSREVKGATLYCTHTPCWDCARDMLQAGIAQVVYGRVYKQEIVGRLTNVEKQGLGVQCVYVYSFTRHSVVMIGLVIIHVNLQHS